ncbi:MAG: tRNA (guanosine(46)-N7)-methyltransferase TrmB, partial [Bacilli bacterium]|nr:tRNA (guanosine(46)-N7)-methyltransferase TrmB [Bacilli bacterium]
MRLKKVKGAGDRINNSPYVIKEPILFKGKYQELFNNSNPLKIEIGMGKGDFIIESAKQYPHINFIGIEKFDSVMVRAIEKLEYLELDNLKLIKMDGLSIDAVFDHEIDTIYLNFSDPWPKKRHQNRRLTSSIFLEKYEQVFKKTKRIVMKTDNRKLFEYSIISFNQHNYKIKDISLDLYDDD